MFSASKYVNDRYAKVKNKPTEAAILRLQSLVDDSGLAGHQALVEAMLNGLTAPEYTAVLDMWDIRTWLQRAAALRGLGASWETALTGYAAGLDAETGLEAAAFYKHCLGTDVLPFQPAAAGAIAGSLPLVVVSQPVVTKGKGSGRRGSIGYTNKDDVTIGAGLFEIVAGFRAPAAQKGQPTMGVLQFASSDRTATFNDGTTVRRSFQNALDSVERPWIKGASVQLAPDAPTILTADDGPKWDLPLQDDQKRELVSVTIVDSYTTHVVTQTDTNAFTTLYTCEWNFTAEYAAAHPEAATQHYTVVRQAPSNTQIRLTGHELLANEQPDLVSK
ncbi:hypothetical protein [Catenulispora sp. EB89]|uniref:hypothetical protein n=1 Tax=Catenulispora sp. EB89 TaxID=3156257 RepID=UPI0035188865